MKKVSDDNLVTCILKTSKIQDIPVRDLLKILGEKFPKITERALTLGFDPSTLESFPLELKEHIALNMSYDQIVHFCGTFGPLKGICNESFWKEKVIHDFGDTLPELTRVRNLKKEFNKILWGYINTVKEKYKLPPTSTQGKLPRIKVGHNFLGTVKTWRQALEQLILLVKWGRVYGPVVGRNPYPFLKEGKFWGDIHRSFMNLHGDYFEISYKIPWATGHVSKIEQTSFVHEIKNTKLVTVDIETPKHSFHMESSYIKSGDMEIEYTGFGNAGIIEYKGKTIFEMPYHKDPIIYIKSQKEYFLFTRLIYDFLKSLEREFNCNRKTYQTLRGVICEKIESIKRFRDNVTAWYQYGEAYEKGEFKEDPFTLLKISEAF